MQVAFVVAAVKWHGDHRSLAFFNHAAPFGTDLHHASSLIKLFYKIHIVHYLTPQCYIFTYLFSCKTWAQLPRHLLAENTMDAPHLPGLETFQDSSSSSSNYAQRETMKPWSPLVFTLMASCATHGSILACARCYGFDFRTSRAISNMAAKHKNIFCVHSYLPPFKRPILAWICSHSTAVQPKDLK